MDDERFKREVLARLDKIVTLLSISCAVSNGSIEKGKAESALRQVMASRPQETEPPVPSLVNDEMREDYLQAMERWNSDKNG